MNKTALFFGLAIIIISVIGSFSIADAINHVNAGYSGKLYFTDEVSFNKFKESLANPDVVINKISSINSIPAVVQFSISIPRDKVFPYGDREVLNGWSLKDNPLLFFTGFIFILGVIVIVLSLDKNFILS